MTDYKQQGLFDRFKVERADHKPLDEAERLFVLRYDKDDPWGAACRASLLEFADRIEAVGYQPLAADLRAQVHMAVMRIDEARAAVPPTAPAVLPL